MEFSLGYAYWTSLGMGIALLPVVFLTEPLSDVEEELFGKWGIPILIIGAFALGGFVIPLFV